MVLESFINPFKAEKQPWQLFFIGFVYSSIAILLSLWIFEKQASFIAVFLTVLAAVPMLYNTMKVEEEKDIELEGEIELLKEHNKAIIFIAFLFLGITVSCVVWYTSLPTELSGYVFSRQAQTIADINNQIVGGTVQQVTLFTNILLNNLKVLAFCILFAFIYGAGAVFIITWNATVIGTAIGNFIRSKLAAVSTDVGLTNIASYFQIASLGLVRYSVHGIPEVFAYFYGGLAGGIISVAVVRHHFGTNKFTNILLDTSDMLLIAIGFLVVAAFFEVYLTPLLF